MAIINEDEDYKKSQYVGVSWKKRIKKWQAAITTDGKCKHLGYFDDEKEAAFKYDDRAAPVNKPVNFPQHEGQEQAVKPRKDRSKVPVVMRRSKFVGVSWRKQVNKWEAKIMIDGKSKHLGFLDDEKEAACKYDDQAALLDKPVNFPQHESQEQAVKQRKDLSKVPDVTRRSKFVGVTYHKQMKKWEAKIVIDGKQRNLGLFLDEKKAACKYDKQAEVIHKPVNFPKEGQNKAKKYKCFDSIDNVQSKRTNKILSR